MALRRRSLITLPLLFPLTACGTAPVSVPPPARLLNPAAFAAETGDRVVVNVHVPDEGELPGTDATIPFDRIREQVAELPADRATPLAVYCRTGWMSSIAADTLVGLRYTDVVDLAGGMVAWLAAGRPVEEP